MSGESFRDALRRRDRLFLAELSARLEGRPWAAEILELARDALDASSPFRREIVAPPPAGGSRIAVLDPAEDLALAVQREALADGDEVGAHEAIHAFDLQAWALGMEEKK